MTKLQENNLNDMKSIIPLTEEEKKLYSKLDFKYFLDMLIKSQKISEENVRLIYSAYNNTLQKHEKIKNKAQHHLFIEGYVRKMHSGGMLAAHFNLIEARSFSIFRYEDYGENWAYFEMWAKKQRCKEWKKVLWERIVEVGAILGYILLVIQLLQLLKK